MDITLSDKSEKDKESFHDALSTEVQSKNGNCIVLDFNQHLKILNVLFLSYLIFSRRKHTFFKTKFSVYSSPGSQFNHTSFSGSTSKPKFLQM